MENFFSEVSPICYVHKSDIPAIFIHGKYDELISIEHSKQIFEVIHDIKSSEAYFLIKLC